MQSELSARLVHVNRDMCAVLGQSRLLSATPVLDSPPLTMAHSPSNFTLLQRDTHLAATRTSAPTADHLPVRHSPNRSVLTVPSTLVHFHPSPRCLPLAQHAILLYMKSQPSSPSRTT